MLLRQPTEAAVEATAQGVGDRRARTRSLRQHALSQRDVIDLAVQLCRQARRLGAEQGEHRRHVPAVAEFLEQALDAAEGDRREEVLQVEVEDDLAAGMRRRIGDDRTARYEPVRRVLNLQPGQDVYE